MIVTSMAELEIDNEIREVEEEIAELKSEYSDETLACPYCGSIQKGHGHKRDAVEAASVIRDLHDKYPQIITYCPLCGAKL